MKTNVTTTARPAALGLLAVGLALTLAASLLVPVPVALAQEAGDDEAPATKRIPLPSLETGRDLPYTVAIPVDWTVRRDLPATGVFLGPPAGDPNSHPEMVYVRQSPVDISDPLAVGEAIRANSAEQPWSVEELQVIDEVGVYGLLVLMAVPRDATGPERKTMTLKLPVGDGSVDLVASAPAERFATLRSHYERILGSVQPAVSEDLEGDGVGEDGEP